MAGKSVLRTKKKLDGGRIILKEIVTKPYKEASSIRSRKFVVSQHGKFGVEHKILMLRSGYSDYKAFLVLESQLYDLSKHLKKRIKDIKKKYGQYARLDFRKDVHGYGCLEVVSGIFRSPMEEHKLDTILKEEIENVASEHGLKPFYGGIEHTTGRKSYGHHVHWSAGNTIDTFLLYMTIRNELWRIAAFAANSPKFNEKSGVKSMNYRLGQTYVTDLVPPAAYVSPQKVEDILENGCADKDHPLLVHECMGTLEVRASDIDIKSSASVAYIVLLLRAMQETTARKKTVAIYRDSIIKKNTLAAKRYAISDEGKVETLIDGEIAKIPIQQEMIRHYEEVIEPVLRMMKREYRKNGKRFIHPQVEEEMLTRIYDGKTPAQRQVDVYMQTIQHGTHREAMIAAQKLNFLN